MSDENRPWLAEYQSYGIEPSLEPYPDQPVHRFLEDAAENHPEQGIHQRGTTVTYPELLADVEALAAALQERGVEPGTRVATVLPTSIQFVLATYAISRTGAVHVPNDFLDAEDDLVYRLETSDPDVLIGRDAHRDLLARLQSAADVDRVILTDLEDYSPEPPEHEEPPESASGEPSETTFDGAVEWLTDVIDEGSENDDGPDPVEIEPETDVHTILFTGGTTGRPKGCQLTHRNLVANALQSTAAQSRVADVMRGREAAVMALPMYHAYGYSITNHLIELGLDVLAVPDGRDTDEMRRLVAEHDPLVVFGVPTQFMELVEEEELDHDVIGISGSAPLAAETKREFDEQSSGVSQGYGLSEMSPITHFHVAGIQEALTGSTDEDRLDRPTVGIPVPDTEVKLVDVDSGEPVAIAEAVSEDREAEMYLNGPQRMKGYLEAPDPFDEDGFVATGDVVRIDERGRFYVVDRVKNMINVSGLKVYPEEVDEELFGMDGVRRPATVGVPDPDRPGSELVKVYVEPVDDAEVTPEAVRSYLEGRVPRQAVPDEVEVVESIPLTDIGKTDRTSLAERDGE